MTRLLFEKMGNAVWISHLDLMRLFQRAFKRAGLKLKHTQGFNPRPSVSIALPLSVGVESRCELLDFELDGQTVPPEVLAEKLNRALIPGVRVLRAYDDGAKLKTLALLDCTVTMVYDGGVPAGAEERIRELFARDSILVEKKSKNGPVMQNIIPMIRSICAERGDGNTLLLRARICCQNPSLNPGALGTAVAQELPELAPSHVRCRREGLYDEKENQFK